VSEKAVYEKYVKGFEEGNSEAIEVKIPIAQLEAKAKTMQVYDLN